MEKVISTGEELGYYERWWSEDIPIKASGNLELLGWKGISSEVELNGSEMVIKLNDEKYKVNVVLDGEVEEPSFVQKFMKAWGWG